MTQATTAHYTSMGLDNRKMAFWAFIGSECLLFGSLISTYLVYKGKSIVGPYPPEILNIPFTSVSTFDLLMSSLMMVLALAAVQRGDMKWGKIWLFSTALRARVPGRPGDRVHGVRAQGADAPDEPVRLHVLRADGDARRARDGRRVVAAHAVGAGAAGKAHQRAC